MTDEIEIVDAEIPAEDRCPAAVGLPTSEAIACPVHPDGVHRCYRRPTHQSDHPDSRPVVFAAHPGAVPEWATHVCDCGFAWANIVQERRPQRRRAPGWAEQHEIGAGR